MAARDGQVRLFQVTALEGMALGLGLAAAEAAGAAARDGGYRPTHAEWREVSAALREAVTAMVLLVDDWAATTDEQLEGAARDLGARVLHEVLGPPPVLN